MLWEISGKPNGGVTGFWGEVMTRRADSHSQFGKALLACPWVLGESELLAIGHDVTVRP